jgi:predicted acylesterase/phospholipase RssA
MQVERAKAYGDVAGIAWPQESFVPPKLGWFCDIVLKGGVTSGIVYPLAICRLAQSYWIKNIGGSSVGAIAAAMTAAAEYRRRETHDGSGYEMLAGLREFFVRPGALQRLFRADRVAQPLLGLALAFVGAGSPASKAASAVARFSLPAWLVVAASVVLTWFAAHGAHSAWQVAAGAFLGACATVAFVFLYYTITFFVVMARNDFGWCHGHSRAFNSAKAFDDVTKLKAGRTPKLTDWLHVLVQRMAGREPAGAPLTFGDLWQAALPPGLPRTDDHSIDLRMVTTCLTIGRPFELPGDLARMPVWFRKEELRSYFATEIIDALVDSQQPDSSGYYALPPPERWPIVFAARLSMSFPVLFCPVKLYTLDADDARKPLWLSDGGLTSNFPIHFFDAPLPRWPTFALDLLGGGRAESAQASPTPYGEGNVFLESEITAGRVNPWNRFGRGGVFTQVAEFFGATIDTMRTWQDTVLASLRGNASRTAGIRLAPEEGGLNLNMPRETIEKLLARGYAAGDLLARMFEPSSPDQAWEKQRWERYRATMSALDLWLERFDENFISPIASNQPDYPAIIRKELRPPDVADALRATRSVADERHTWGLGGHAPRFRAYEPDPPTELQARPRPAQ